MKWFKHQSDLPRDEGVSRYLDEAGKDRLTAYGFLMFVLEAIALRMGKNGDPTCSADYSLSQWGRITYSHPNRVRKYLQLCEVIGWVQVEFGEGTCRVEIEKMLDWRDETTSREHRKSGVVPGRGDKNREEKNREEKRETSNGATPSGGRQEEDAELKPPPDFEVTAEMRQWAADKYPTVNVDHETETFRLYEFTRPCSDWEARWKRWIIRAAEHQAKHGGSTSQPNRDEELLKLAKDLHFEQREGESQDQYLTRFEKYNERRIANLGRPH